MTMMTTTTVADQELWQGEAVNRVAEATVGLGQGPRKKTTEQIYNSGDAIT